MDPSIEFNSLARLRQDRKSSNHCSRESDPSQKELPVLPPSPELLKTLYDDCIHSTYTHDSPFGKKKSTYLDWFASGRPMRSIESVLSNTVLPFYANTHTHSTSTAKFTSASVANSRKTIIRCVNAQTAKGHRHEAVVLFCGDGSTSAINKVRNLFRLNDAAFWARKALAQTRECAPSAHKPLSSCGSDSGSSETDTDTPVEKTATETASSALLRAQLLESLANTHHLPPQFRPVVFLSIQEHHSNLLPWRESVAEVVVIHEDPQTSRLDLVQLEKELLRYHDRPLKIGTFSAGSNLTGVLNDTVAISELLHKYGAYAFYDYAGVGSYTKMDMNPPPSDPSIPIKDSLAYKDGIFLSPHKFVGGPGASGVLVSRLEIFSWVSNHNHPTVSPVAGGDDGGGKGGGQGCKNCQESAPVDPDELFTPVNPGGGTVDMVIRGTHKYTNSVIAREEAGTPNILATIRVGLVFGLQEVVDPRWIITKEYELSKSIYTRLLKLAPMVSVLGTPELDRVAVFCMTVSVPPERLALPTLSSLPTSTSTMSMLPARESQEIQGPRNSPLQIHYSLLSMIMNDFFGIEMRGGCMCAGPYASQLLQFDAQTENDFWNLLLDENTGRCTSCADHQKSNVGLHGRDLASPGLKPGFVRFSFPYFSRSKDIDFVLESLEWVAHYGFLLIPFYRLDPASGTWSIREAVREAVVEMNKIAQPRHPHFLTGRGRAKGGSRRSDYIPIAIDCIAGLQQLFQLQETLALEQVQASKPISSGREGLRGLLSHAKRTFQRRQPSPEKLSDHPMATPISKRQLLSEVTMSVQSPALGPTSPDSSSESLASSEDSDCSASSLSLSPSTSFRYEGRRAGLGHQRRLGARHQREHALHSKTQAALQELCMEGLSAEHVAIESSPLAAKLRWFVTPLEVARLYKSRSLVKDNVFPCRR